MAGNYLRLILMTIVCGSLSDATAQSYVDVIGTDKYYFENGYWYSRDKMAHFFYVASIRSSPNKVKFVAK